MKKLIIIVLLAVFALFAALRTWQAIEYSTDYQCTVQSYIGKSTKPFDGKLILRVKRSTYAFHLDTRLQMYNAYNDEFVMSVGVPNTFDLQQGTYRDHRAWTQVIAGTLNIEHVDIDNEYIEFNGWVKPEPYDSDERITYTNGICTSEKQSFISFNF